MPLKEPCKSLMGAKSLRPLPEDSCSQGIGADPGSADRNVSSMVREAGAAWCLQSPSASAWTGAARTERVGCSRVTHRASWETTQEGSAFPAPGDPSPQAQL